MKLFGLCFGQSNTASVNTDHSTNQSSQVHHSGCFPWRRCRKALCVAARVVCAVATLGVSELVLMCVSHYRASHAASQGPFVVHHTDEADRRNPGGDNGDELEWDHSGDIKTSPYNEDR